MVLTGLAYSLVYCKSVSCKCLVDNPERKLSNSVVGGRIALHCDLLVMVLHEASLVSLCFYQATYTSSIRGIYRFCNHNWRYLSIHKLVQENSKVHTFSCYSWRKQVGLATHVNSVAAEPKECWYLAECHCCFEHNSNGIEVDQPRTEQIVGSAWR